MHTQSFIALLRGINVGGRHKAPMAGVRKAFEDMGFGEVKTLLNSGNVVFSGKPQPVEEIETRISRRLEEVFGFPIPVLVRSGEEIKAIIESEPFKGIEVTKDIRLYVTFVRKPPENLQTPRIAPDGSFKILAIREKAIFSVLNVSLINTPDAMSILEKSSGKDITTRNWNTVVKIHGMLSPAG